jgi:uncharacterized protein (UPF0261 family)
MASITTPTRTPTTILLLGTLDTKFPEYLHLHHLISTLSPQTRIYLLDAGRTPSYHPLITHPQSSLLALHPKPPQNLMTLPRGELMKTLIAATTPLVRQLYSQNEIHACIALGGSGGTTLASSVFRSALPLGFPKLIVSTVASGDTSMHVGETDLMLMYSVVDIAGLNEMLKNVLRNAAGAIIGMANAYAGSLEKNALKDEPRKKSVGITMFGVTTPGVDVARRRLEDAGYEVYVFHATGSGGRAMERMVLEGRIDAVLDLTTTELADELVGGVFSAGKHRLTAASQRGIPQLVSLGALDMVNFGPRDTVPERFQGRTLYEHNASVTLMRTTAAECAELGKVIAERLREHCKNTQATEVWLPLKGVSMLSVLDQPFYDSQADEQLFSAVKKGLEGSGIRVVEVDADVNNSVFAERMAAWLMHFMNGG